MEGYEKYEELMANWAIDYMRPFVGSHEKAEMPAGSKAFFGKIFDGFSEISRSYEALKLAEILISVAPPRSKKINRDEYIKYHINAYLQEVYILKERLNSYLTKLKRVYKKTKQKEKFEEETALLFDLVKKTLGGVVDTRGDHVHEYRYNDDELIMLSSLTLISNHDDEFLTFASLSYQKVKRIWSTRIKENNITTKKLLDMYFERLYEAVTVDGKIVVPKNAIHSVE